MVFDEFKRLNRAERYKIQRENLYKVQLNKHLELNKEYFNKISLTFKKINLVLKLLNSYIELYNKAVINIISEDPEILLDKSDTTKSKSKKELIYNYIKYIEELNIEKLKSKDINNLKEEFLKIKAECIKERIIIENVNLDDFYKNFKEFFNFTDNKMNLSINLDSFFKNSNKILKP
jgi:hypothetical protein